jgi:hypothetical protein
LKDIGFILPGFDTEYDTIRDANNRLLAVMTCFERYMEMPQAERSDWISDTWDACRENMETFIEKTDIVIQQSFEDLAAACQTQPHVMQSPGTSLLPVS